jgi:hypothetical protein
MGQKDLDDRAGLQRSWRRGRLRQKPLSLSCLGPCLLALWADVQIEASHPSAVDLPVFDEIQERIAHP